MALTLTAISPPLVSLYGGDKVTVTGVFLRTRTYEVVVGGEEEANPPVVAYSGVAGQGDVIFTPDETTISFAMPRLEFATPTNVNVREIGGEGEPIEAIQIVALERVFHSTVFSMRRMFPPWYATGARRLDLEPAA